MANDARARIDWSGLASTAVLLGWSPDVFWAATPADYWAACAVLRKPEDSHCGADKLQQMKRAFPDEAALLKNA